MLKDMLSLIVIVLLELIKNVMAQRFNSETNHLNLSNFHRDPAFLEYNGYIPLARSVEDFKSRQNCLLAGLNLIRHCPSKGHR